MQYSTVIDLVYILETLMGPWRGPKIATKSQVQELLDANRAVVGRRKLRLALELAQENVGSWQETTVRLSIVKAGLPVPTVQVSISIPELGCVARPDMVFEDFMVIVECEGDHHRTDEDQFSYDLKRYYYLEKQGWKVIRVSKRTSMQWLIAELADVLRRRGWDGESSVPADVLNCLR